MHLSSMHGNTFDVAPRILQGKAEEAKHKAQQ
jgi:hypothetical protein